MPTPAGNAETSAALHRCLSPDPSARPTAAELRAILSGRGPKPAAKPASSAVSTSPPKPVKPSPIAAVTKRAQANPIVSERLELSGGGGHSLMVGIRTELGEAPARQFGPDGDYWDALQCVVERRSGRPWSIIPVEGTTNETLVNGETLKAPRELRDGDLIAVGRQAKGIVKMPLTVQGR